MLRHTSIEIIQSDQRPKAILNQEKYNKEY